MTTSSFITVTALLAGSSSLLGCTVHHHAPPPIAAVPAPPGALPPDAAQSNAAASKGAKQAKDRRVYRFDFVLTASESSGPTSTSFTLNLEENEKGEVSVGKNVQVGPGAASSSPPHTGGPRQDVGIKVAARFESVGDDVLLDVSTEVSAFEPPSTVRKMIARGNALASPGKSALVTTLDGDRAGYKLSVTPTRVQ